MSNGISVRALARQHGWSVETLNYVLRENRAGTRAGQAHEIAVALGLKQPRPITVAAIRAAAQASPAAPESMAGESHQNQSRRDNSSRPYTARAIKTARVRPMAQRGETRFTKPGGRNEP